MIKEPVKNKKLTDLWDKTDVSSFFINSVRELATKWLQEEVRIWKKDNPLYSKEMESKDVPGMKRWMARFSIGLIPSEKKIEAEFKFVKDNKTIGDFLGGYMVCSYCKEGFADAHLHNLRCDNKFDFSLNWGLYLL